jgi:hypothetical protein
MPRSNVVLPQPLGPDRRDEIAGIDGEIDIGERGHRRIAGGENETGWRISTAGSGLPAAMVTAGRATTTSTIDHPAAACWSIARSSTLQPAARSAGSALSTSLWLMPSAQGTKTMPTGATRLI